MVNLFTSIQQSWWHTSFIIKFERIFSGCCLSSPKSYVYPRIWNLYFTVGTVALLNLFLHAYITECIHIYKLIQFKTVCQTVRTVENFKFWHMEVKFLHYSWWIGRQHFENCKHDITVPDEKILKLRRTQQERGQMQKKYTKDTIVKYNVRNW